jgi:hypothetical protein
MIEMAKKTEKDIEGRVLSKVISGAGVLVGSGGAITITGGEGWQTILVSGQHIIYNIQSFDLSGYALQDKTMFPQGCLFQDMAVGARAQLCASAQRTTIMSTTPLTENDLSTFAPGSGIWVQPGSLNSTHKLNNIIQGRLQQYLTLTTLAGLQQTYEGTWGSGDSTAADRMWMCDAWLIPNIEGSSLQLPDMAFVVPAIITQEADLEYMMRLSRSLEPVY